MTRTYTARPGTRITENAGARLRQLALIRRRRLSHVLDDVPGAALPTAADLTAQPGVRRVVHRREERDETATATAVPGADIGHRSE